MPETIPFNRPYATGNEHAYLEQAIADTHWASKGTFSHKAAELLRAAQGAEDVLLTTSCTDALEMTAMLLDLKPGDVVIVPSFTFSSTATAFARQGAKLRFCDIQMPNLGLDPVHVEASMDEDVRAIVTVHYAGVAGDVTALAAIAARYGVPLIEDNAHGIFGTHQGTPLGSFGRMSTLSFHETKNFACGEGGALVLNDPADVEQAHVLIDKGTNRQRFIDGQIDKYTWQGPGSSFGLSELLAAFLLAQLEDADNILSRRRALSETYRELLEPHVTECGFTLPFKRPSDKPADHMFYVLLPEARRRSEIISSMRDAGVSPTFHYVPLHSAPGGLALCDRYQECPVTDDVSARLLRLPFFTALEEAEQLTVVEALIAAIRATA